jgi:hypothetical protein
MGHRRAYIGVQRGSREGDWLLTEVDTYDWITFLPMSHGTGAFNRYFGKLNTGEIKIWGVWLERATLQSMSIECNRRSSMSYQRRGAISYDKAQS